MFLCQLQGFIIGNKTVILLFINAGRGLCYLSQRMFHSHSGSSSLPLMVIQQKCLIWHRENRSFSAIHVLHLKSLSSSTNPTCHLVVILLINSTHPFTNYGGWQTVSFLKSTICYQINTQTSGCHQCNASKFRELLGGTYPATMFNAMNKFLISTDSCL